MKKNSLIIGAGIIGSAIIWGAVILGCSLKLEGTGCYENISKILSVGAAIHLLFIWGPMAAFVAKLIKKKD